MKVAGATCSVPHCIHKFFCAPEPKMRVSRGSKYWWSPVSPSYTQPLLPHIYREQNSNSGILSSYSYLVLVDVCLLRYSTAP